MKKLLIVLTGLVVPTLLFGQRTWDTIPFIPNYYRERYEKFKAEPIVKDKVIFLGNSITEGGNWRKMLKDSSVINRGIAGDITFGVLNRIDEVVRRQPSKVFLLIGINDLAKGIPDEVVIENIFTIVSRIKRRSPKTQVFVQSILPTNSTIPKPPLPEHVKKGEHIITINGQLQKYADKLKFTFVDLYPKFIDNKGQLDVKYSADGVHLNLAGYQLWVATLKELNLL